MLRSPCDNNGVGLLLGCRIVPFPLLLLFPSCRRLCCEDLVLCCAVLCSSTTIVPILSGWEQVAVFVFFCIATSSLAWATTTSSATAVWRITPRTLLTVNADSSDRPLHFFSSAVARKVWTHCSLHLYYLSTHTTQYFRLLDPSTRNRPCLSSSACSA
jgi:hypothetical protein